MIVRHGVHRGRATRLAVALGTALSSAAVCGLLVAATPVAAASPVLPSSAIAMDGTPAGLPGGGVTVQPYTAATVMSQARLRAASPASASGCLAVDAWRNEYTLLGALAYRWHVTDHYCWSANRITSTTTGYYVSDADGFEIFNGIAGTDDYYFVHFSGVSNSGHYTYREAAMENCIWAVCLSTQYPWVSITAYGDGSYSYSYGG
ncbi:MAG TPA: hypothetical protein VEI48_02455 [Candidatus Sulfotelmatobacter sp.]|nr:hypothetical protein [Candidatus Sulfotelmatobacter sp.]